MDNILNFNIIVLNLKYHQFKKECNHQVLLMLLHQQILASLKLFPRCLSFKYALFFCFSFSFSLLLCLSPFVSLSLSHRQNFFFLSLKYGGKNCLQVKYSAQMEREMATHSSTLAGKSHGWRSLVGYSPRGRKESDTTERIHFTSQCPDLDCTDLARLPWELLNSRENRVSKWS